MEERRKTPRRKTLKAGMIITYDHFSTVNCVVRNVSEGGAKIEVPAAVPLSGRFELLFEHRTVACELVWRSRQHLGVRFADAQQP
jgi:hypothetical protein